MRSVELGIAPSWTLRVYRPVLTRQNPAVHTIRDIIIDSATEQGLRPTLSPYNSLNAISPSLVLFDRSNFKHAAHPSIEAMSKRSEELAKTLADALSGDRYDNPISCEPDTLIIRSIGSVSLFGIGYRHEQAFDDAQEASSRIIEYLAAEPLDMQRVTPYVMLGAVQGNDDITRQTLHETWSAYIEQRANQSIKPVEFGPVTIDYDR